MPLESAVVPDAALQPAPDIFPYPSGVLVPDRVPLELRPVQADRLRVAREVRLRQRPLVLEQHLVHLPEFAQPGGRLGDLRSVLGVRVRPDASLMPERPP